MDIERFCNAVVQIFYISSSLRLSIKKKYMNLHNKSMPSWKQIELGSSLNIAAKLGL
jgi:hypothetical protein